MNDSVRVGDRVVIRAVRYPGDERFVGVQGKVAYCSESGRRFAVRTDGNVLTIVTAVDKISDEGHDVPGPPAASEASELDRRRVQAATFAYNLLGKDALPEEVLGLADWVLNEPTEVSAADVYRDQWGEALRKASDLVAKVDGHYTADQLRAAGFLPDSVFLSPIVAEESKPEPPRQPDYLEIRDKDGDRATFRYLGRPNYFVMVDAHNTDGDVCSAYVTADDADRIIDFLQDAKAAKA